MKKILTYLLAVAVLIGAYFGAKEIIQSKQDAQEQIPVAKKYGVKVRTMKPSGQKTILSLPYLAISQNNDNVKINSRLSGRIEYAVQNGAKVHKDDLLVQLDKSDLEAKMRSLALAVQTQESMLASKKIALENTLGAHQTTIKLLKVKGATKEQFDSEVSNIEALKSAIESIELKIESLNEDKKSLTSTLSYASITAPVDGIVTALVSKGDVAMMGSPLVSISSSAKSFLLLRLPEGIEFYGAVYRGEPYKLHSLGTTFNGMNEYIININAALSSNQKVEVAVLTFDDMGYFLPYDAILNRDGKSFVLGVENDKAKAKEITILAKGKEGVVINEQIDFDIVVAKADIMLRLLSGVNVVQIKSEQ